MINLSFQGRSRICVRCQFRISRGDPRNIAVSDMVVFQPTPESIPPPNVVYRLHMPLENIPAHHTPLNPVSFLLRAARVFPDKLAIVHPDVPYPVSYTFAVWAQRVQNLAYALIQAGVQPGDRVAVIAPNCPLIADAHFGVLAARAVITPINIRLTKPEVDYILDHSGTKLVLVDHEFTHFVKDSKLQVIVSHDTGRAGDEYEAFLSSGRRHSAEKGWGGLSFEPDEDANASLCYTSGTTGKPKGAVSTFRGSYLAAVANTIETRMDYNSVYLWILPMFHACGWTFPWANVLAFTTQITLRTVNYDLIWKHLVDSGVTHYCAAPTVQIGIVNSPNACVMKHPVSAIIAGSAPTAHLISQLEKKSITPVHVYGLTETYGPFTRNYTLPGNLSLAERAKLISRQGHAFATADDVRVVNITSDGTLVDVPPDGKSLGEIAIRGNIVMKEYYRDTKATASAFKGGHFTTGDLAVKYPDHSIYILDRSKDIIISGGEVGNNLLQGYLLADSFTQNASSLAIEQELAEHPDVLEVAVVARKHDKWGERPMAFVILNTKGSKKWKDSADGFSSDLKRWVRGKLPGFAIPEWVVICEDLPKTSTGKIQKARLRQMIANNEVKSKL